MPKKAKPASDKELNATIKKLEADLRRADAKAARWKKRAASERSASATSRAQVVKLEKKLAKSRRTALLPSGNWAGSGPEGPLTQDLALDEATPAAAAPPTPDDSWTVAALRAEARSRGLSGLSRKSKADLLAALA